MNKHHTTNTWLSVYLFYNEPWEEFLQKAIEPYVNTAIQTGIAQQYFFIRYWENGPHIRLRLKGEMDMVNTILKPNLEEHFTNYFESMPSRRIEPQYPANFSEDLKWYPNNSIKYEDYESEVGRYGGDVGILLAEEQFMVSSKTVLDFIKQKGRSWSYDDAMGVSIKLHLTFIHSAGLDIQEAIDFYDFFAKNWLPYTFKKSQGEINNDDFQHQSNLSIQAFEDSFSTQKEILIPFHSVLWNALEEGDSFEEDILNLWVQKNKDITNQVKSAFENNNLTDRKTKYKYKIPPKNPQKNGLVWSIFADYIHLTNNRLGILNKDESYLSFMMMRCLQEIKKNKNSSVATEIPIE